MMGAMRKCEAKFSISMKTMAKYETLFYILMKTLMKYEIPISYTNRSNDEVWAQVF